MDCSGQCPHSPAPDLSGMGQLVSQTVSLIYFKGWKTQHMLFCTGLSLEAHCLLMAFIKIRSPQQIEHETNRKSLAGSSVACRGMNSTENALL